MTARSRTVFRSLAALFLVWGAWSKSADASCTNNAYCNWHPLNWDFCDPGDGTHCEMNSQHECFTADGNCMGTVN